MVSEQNKRFIQGFNSEKYGFYEVTPFSDCTIGFSLKKDFGNDDFVTLIQVYIPEKVYADQGIAKKPLSVYATYGKKTDNGVSIRRFEDLKISDPIDLEFPNEFFYEIVTGDLFKGKRRISAEKLLEYVYGKHVKTTKPLRGLFTRIKLRFWWIFMRSVSDFVSKIFYCLLWLISGNRYEYRPFLEEATLNGEVISSKLPRRINTTTNDSKERLREARKFQFLQYEASFWSIIFYSIVHMGFYLLFMYEGYAPRILTTIFKNNFLTLVYVILSLFVIEFVIPKLLMWAIKCSSKFSSFCSHKKVRF